MKKKIILALVAIVALGAMSFDILSSNGKAGYTGSPGETTCNTTNCHNSYTLNSGSGSIAISSLPSLANGYVPDSVYTITVTVSDAVAPNNALFGFGCEALLASGANGGTLAITNTALTKLATKSVSGNVRNNVVQLASGLNVGPNTQPFSFHWTAPADGSGTVTFYTAGVAADNSGDQTGDYVYNTSMAVNESTVGIKNVVAQEFNFSIFPNPSSNNLNVKFSLKGISTVVMDLIDLNGKKVASLISANGMNGEVNRTFDISSYAKGVYFVSLKINNQSTMEKIVVE